MTAKKPKSWAERERRSDMALNMLDACAMILKTVAFDMEEF